MNQSIASIRHLIQQQVYTPAGLTVFHERADKESQRYDACTFEVNGRLILHRMAKITPAKNGQFVTIWQRDICGTTVPFSQSDGFNFLIITIREDNRLGQFIIPMCTLIHKGIVSTPQKEGKRGIRVYPPWVVTNSKQATKTQTWQVKYFYEVGRHTLSEWFEVFNQKV